MDAVEFMNKPEEERNEIMKKMTEEELEDLIEQQTQLVLKHLKVMPVIVRDE